MASSRRPQHCQLSSSFSGEAGVPRHIFFFFTDSSLSLDGVNNNNNEMYQRTRNKKTRFGKMKCTHEFLSKRTNTSNR